jgi:hypothetical protein
MTYDPNVGFTNEFNTELTPDERNAFNEYMINESLNKGRNLYNDMYDYDMQGAWKDGATSPTNNNVRGHLGDKFKKPNHPTFSTESQYSANNAKNAHLTQGVLDALALLGNPIGGQWNGNDETKWTFIPSKANYVYQDPIDLQEYFDREEPDAWLDDGVNRTLDPYYDAGK